MFDYWILLARRNLEVARHVDLLIVAAAGALGVSLRVAAFRALVGALAVARLGNYKWRFLFSRKNLTDNT